MNDVSAAQFWDHLDRVRTAMLEIGEVRLTPMTVFADEKARAIWFITAKGTDLETASRVGPVSARLVVSSEDARLYGTIQGQAVQDTNRDKLDEIWNAFADAWFDEGKSDPDLRMIRMDVTEAEVWITEGTAKAMYEFAKSKVTGDRPQAGYQGHLTFRE